jgi:putative nucleotidyltransferase with HDIG domain
VAFKSLGFALVGSAAAYFTCSSLLISIAMALWERRSALGLWVVSFRWVAPRSLALAPFGLLMAMVYQIQGLGLFAVALFVAPLVGARYVFQGAMEMLEVHRETVHALSNALEAYDPYTRNHSELVTRYALQLGRELELSAAQLEVLEWAGRLHDIGKCRQDWEPIIRKPGRPSEQEWQVIRQHPIEGSRLAEKMEFLPHTAGMVAAIVHAHHERLDGSGYPDGKGEQQLPLEARILGVADAFEAMTAKRAYHQQRPPEEAVAELRRCAGTQFDPRVVEALASLWERGELRMEEPPEQSLLLPSSVTNGVGPP